jgi:LysM repeat protein/GH25 family lysozyme M1 (1,4-beta-N-acetylmuramidase)
MDKLNKFVKSVRGLALATGLAFSVAPFAHAQAPNVDFIDVSSWQGHDGLPLAFYQTIKSAGVQGVVVKVSEGEYYVDPSASVNVANAKAAGMLVNAYHFARFTSVSSAQAEAKWMDKKLQLVGFDKSKDGYVVVDVEAADLSGNPDELTAETNAFIEQMFQLGYLKIDLYSGSYFYNSRLKPNDLMLSQPWLAAYPANPQKGQPTAKFSNGQGAWQWASDYRFRGMEGYGNIDVSEDYAGKYTGRYSGPVKNSTPVGVVKQIGSVSLVDYMKSQGMDASFANRSKVAAEYGIENYSGTASQNLALLSKLQSGVKPAKVNVNNSPLTTNTPVPVVQKASTYTVQYGDSLSKIASRYGTTVSALASINGIKNVNFIRTGQVLKLSGSATVTSSASKVTYYTVRKGDTVWYLSRYYGTSMTQIRSWNRLGANYVIYPGQKLRVR